MFGFLDVSKEDKIFRTEWKQPMHFPAVICLFTLLKFSHCIY